MRHVLAAFTEIAYPLSMFKVSRSVFLPAALAVLSLGSSQAEPAGISHPEFPVENEALIQATIAFFDEVEAREAPRKRIPVIGVPFTVTKSNLPTDDANALTRMGPVDHLTGYRITFYPVDRLLGTVDFMGTWGGKKNLVCGYLTWDLTDPQAPVLQSLSASFVDVGDLSRASEVEIHRDLLRANCAFGEIDANYYVFDVSG